MTNISLRKVEISEVDTLCQLASETFYHTFRPHNTEADMQGYISKAYHTDTIREQLHQPSYHFVMAWLDDHIPVGYYKLILNSTHPKIERFKTAELEKIYVHHPYFGKNAGMLLMDDAISFCSKNLFDVLFLGVWKENERAVAFYKKCGFEIFDTRNFQLGERICEDYMMMKQLTPSIKHQ
jgi:ribosomal protein S18 acetylase RimI-like enzyme